jgi:hypothetical protein
MTANRKSKLAKKWYTIAYLNREGIPTGRHGQFEQWYRSKAILLDDLSHIMSTEAGHQGAYVAAAWPGQISPHEALHGKTKPLYYVYQGGSVETL